MKILKTALAIFCIFLVQFSAQSQGCSDAGVCTLNALKPTGSTELTRNHFKIGYTNGLADYDISVNGGYLEYGRMFSKRFGIDVKVAALGQSGNNISEFGSSDFYLNGKYGFNEKTAVTLGAKIPLNKADKQMNGLGLPMDYQSSLGTFDLILGISHSVGRFHLVAAYQQPLTQNENTFLAEAYDPTSKLREFQSTNQFERAGDVLLRVSYPFHFGEKLRITPSLLPIYHLADDKFTDSAGKQQSIEGSNGFTLNGNVYVDYSVGKNGNLQLSLASPFIVREARPDGLTRGYVVGLEYGVNF